MGVSPSDGSEVEKQIYYEHHQAHLNWCTGTYALTPHGYGQHGIQCAVPGCDGGLSPTSTLGGLFKTQKVVPLPPALWRWDGLPPGVVLVGASAPQSQGNQLPAYYAREWMDDKRWRKHAGRTSLCLPDLLHASRRVGQQDAHARDTVGECVPREAAVSVLVVSE